MCGILAVVSIHDNLTVHTIADQLSLLKHRGHDGYGIALINKDRSKKIFREIGMVKRNNLPNHTNITVSLGHTRYKTMGPMSAIQPLQKESLILIHNGQVSQKNNNNNSNRSDSEQLLNYLATFDWDRSKLSFETIYQWIKSIAAYFTGSYSCILSVCTAKLNIIVAFRDPRGIRPLSYQYNEQRVEIASETVALSTNNNNDILPGECIIYKIDDNAITMHRSGCMFPTVKPSPCLFEYFYFAHPQSILNGVHIETVRKEFGKTLAHKLKTIIMEQNIDIVIPIPETSCIAAYTLAQELDMQYIEALVKIRKRRTFILAGQSNRDKAIRQKFSLKKGIDEVLNNKSILLVDDSIVRGTTIKHVINMLKRQCNLKHIAVASLAPPIIYPNYYGIDITSDMELLAVQCHKDYQLMAERINADCIIYQNLQDMLLCLKELNPKIEHYECSVFNGQYV